MEIGSFAEYLAGLDERALVELLEARPDVRGWPTPVGYAQLAQRLSLEHTTQGALRRATRDSVVVSQAVATFSTAPNVAELARRLAEPRAAVTSAVAELCGFGLAWLDAAGRVHLTEPLAEHWDCEIGPGRPAAGVADAMSFEELAGVAGALGLDPAGKERPELVGGVLGALADSWDVTTRVAGLSQELEARLQGLRNGRAVDVPGYSSRPATAPLDEQLASRGLLLRCGGKWELPREVCATMWFAERPRFLTGPPEVAPASPLTEGQRESALTAVESVLRAVTALVDEARTARVATTRAGGIAAKERARLGERLALSPQLLTLAIDLSYAADLLDRVKTSYAPTQYYDEWRDSHPALQWAELATAWFRLTYSSIRWAVVRSDRPEYRPPPLSRPGTGAGSLRRGLLRACVRDGLSARSVAAQLDWFCPMSGYPATAVPEEAAVAMWEAELMGVLAEDSVTEWGALLVELADADPEVLAAQVAPLFPEPSSTLVLGPDLTAAVSGRPATGLARLLAVASVSEVRGPAAIWRFTPASVRRALDAGWTGEQLCDELAVMSGAPLPHRLELLVERAARRHGELKVRELRSCVTGEEELLTRLLRLRSLATLQLSRLAPTVLSSPLEPARVLAKLRAAGLSPVAEDTTGAIIVQPPKENQAELPDKRVRYVRDGQLEARLMAVRLRSGSAEQAIGDLPASDTMERLSALNPRLPDAELAMLAHAVDHEHDVMIIYRTRSGGRSRSRILPRDLSYETVHAWSYRGSATIGFEVARILSVYLAE